MKKFFTILCALMLVICAKAQDTDVTSMTDALYIDAGVISTSGTSTLDVMMKTSQDITTAGAKFFFPEGIVPTNVNSIVDVPAQGNFVASGVDGTNYYIILFNATTKDQKIETTDEPICVAHLTVTVDPAKVQAGKYQISSQQQELCGASTINPADITKTITAQRAAVVNSLPVGYGVEIIPQPVTRGEQNLTFVYYCDQPLSSLSFDVELPKGMYFMDSEWTATFNGNLATLNETGTTTKTVTHVDKDLSKFTVTINGAYAKKSGKWTSNLNAQTSIANIITVGPVYIESDEDIAEYHDDFIAEGFVDANGINNVKITNIKMALTDGAADATTVYTGNYIGSLFLGTPTDTDPILYGHYTTDALATVKSLATNFRTVDMSAAIVDEDLVNGAPSYLQDKLVLGPTKTSYSRTVTGLGTVCLPIALPVDGAATYYTLKEAGASGVVFTKAETTVPANTPVLVKGKIAVSAEGYSWPESVTPSTSGDWKINGTYEKLTGVKGVYYTAGEKTFYKATNAEGITINPFRAYLESSSSVKSFQVYLDDETGLHEVTDQLSEQDIYNLQGMKLGKAQKGINIINGKKVLVK